MLDNLHIVTWNANGLLQRVNELELFLCSNHIDLAQISETHFTSKNYLKIPGYTVYSTTDPSGRARGGIAILIKHNIQHFRLEEIREEFIQATVITVRLNGAKLSIAAAYCPPVQKIGKNSSSTSL